MSKVRTHYDNLKVARDAPMEVIRAAYKSLALKHHPDRNGNSVESQRAMQIINSAYTVLSDPEQRHRHDEWIARMEGETSGPPRSRPSPQPGPSSPPLTLKSGRVKLGLLDEKTRSVLLSRIPKSGGQQFGIPLKSVLGYYVLAAATIGWIVYLVVQAFDYRWNGQTRDWYGAITLVAFFALGYCLNYLFAWHKSPIKSWLLVTPLYVVRTNVDDVRFWPIVSISDIEATHNYRSGRYQDTSLRVWFDGKLETFVIKPSSAYANFVSKLKQHDGEARAALFRRDGNYFAENDDFAAVADSGKATSVPAGARWLASYAVALAVCLAGFFAAWAVNSGRPSMAITRSADASGSSHLEASPSAKYVRPSSAPNGSPWPFTSGAVQGYELLRVNGLSSVTIDNSRNDSDVFARLVHLQDDKVVPVRSIFIKRGEKYEIESVEPGRYDLRYQDLDSGALSRSEPLTLTQTTTATGIRYDQVTMTLYKVSDGNMRTYSISPEEFL